MITIFNYLLISNIFTNAFILFKRPFEFYVGYIFMFFFLGAYVYFFRTLKINKVFIFTFFLADLFSCLNIFWGNDSFFLFFKQFTGFLLNGVVYYLLFRVNEYNIEKLFRIYMKFSFIIALIAVFQEFSFLIGFKYGYDFSYFIPYFKFGSTSWGLMRVCSILPEPSHFGAAMAPAMFISVLNIIKKESNFISQPASLLIIISGLLTFSLISYFGIIIALLLIMLNHKQSKLIINCSVILLVFSGIAYLCLPDIQLRVNDTVSVLFGNTLLGKGSNLSTFAFCSNAMVAFKSFLRNPLFGSGLGSYPLSYAKYIAGLIGPNPVAKFTIPLCVDDAGSLFFRVISETGLLGIGIFFYFMIKNYVPRKKDGNTWMISNAILCLFFMNLIRMGNYFYCGFIFFVWAYYFTNKASQNKLGINSTKI
jgi:hypothetical protein